MLTKPHQAWLGDGSADFRFERSVEGALILRADGSEEGCFITEETAMSALHGLVSWFVETGGCEMGRMTRHLRSAVLPAAWRGEVPRKQGPHFKIGPTNGGTILGAPLGKMRASDLRALFEESGATRMRPMLQRLLFLDARQIKAPQGFETAPSRLMDIQACAGAPFCQHATVETVAVARQIARFTEGTVHVSGCEKGCACPGKADLTLVGRGGQFDLVKNGQPWDAPLRRGLDPAKLIEMARFSDALFI
ncbi:MAG: hypothetical protein AAF307_12070 [Pseudomonadota bacterium]